MKIILVMYAAYLIGSIQGSGLYSTAWHWVVGLSFGAVLGFCAEPITRWLSTSGSGEHG